MFSQTFVIDIIYDLNFSDLKMKIFFRLGLATAPVLFAADQFGELNQLIQRRFCEKNDVEKAFNFVLKSDGMEQTKFLAQSYGEAALQAIKTWKDSDAKTELTHLLHDAIQRAA